MKNANITAWVNDLATTDAEQAQDALCYVSSDGRKSYCCLGKGSTLVPGMPMRFPDFETEQPGTYFGTGKVRFGYDQEDGLAPREFMRWLGYGDEVEEAWAFNVFIDFPEDLRDPKDTLLHYFGAADLNDSGFSFAEIADIIRHFGLQDKARS